MPTALPPLSYEEFGARLEAASPVALDQAATTALYAHYQELRRWSGGLSLVGPGTADEVVERHYAESLAGVPLVPAAARILVDVGSGAGFPGVPLAAALPRVEVTLIEPRQRRWSFLLAAVRRAGLSSRCLDARVDDPLPSGLPPRIDVVTARALKLAPPTLAALASRLGPDGRILLWAGDDEPELPDRLRLVGQTPLPGSERRRILRLDPS